MSVKSRVGDERKGGREGKGTRLEEVRAGRRKETVKGSEAQK